jgi:peptidyl-prolyl cis-trans isomerase SurA
MIGLLGAAAIALAASGTRVLAAHDDPQSVRLASNSPAAAAEPSASELAGTVANNGDGIAAIVNDTPISNYDLQQRMALFLATSGVRPSPEALKSIREQVLRQLETERLELLEAQKNNITVAPADVDKAINNIISDNRLTMDQLKNLLSQSGVAMATLRAQIATQIAWSKVVEDQYGDRIHITPEEVSAELARIENGANKPRFHVLEIFEAVDSPEQDGKVLKDMTDLYSQIQSGAPFSAVARQFSQNPTAAQGGDLGWVQEGQLPGELDAALITLHPGDVSQPIRSTGGYYILEYRERQEPVGTKLPAAVQSRTATGSLPLARVLLPIGSKPSKELADRAMQAAGILRSHIAGCERLKDVVGKMPGAVYMSLGTMRLTELSAEIQNALGKTDPGGSTEPFESAAGIEIIVRCDKPVPQASVAVIPSRDEVEQELYEDQISVIARRYLRDLRRDADVETR